MFGSYLYHKASFLSHSCLPNAMWYIQENEELQLRASIPIRRGDILTCSCVDLENGTYSRRIELGRDKIFCACAKCRDPAELGTYMSAVKCRSCTDGYYLMVEPLKDKSGWKCNQNSCPGVKTWDEIETIVSQVETQYRSIDAELSTTRDPSQVKNQIWRIKKYQEFLEQNEGKILHRSHSILFKGRRWLGHLITQVSLISGV